MRLPFSSLVILGLLTAAAVRGQDADSSPPAKILVEEPFLVASGANLLSVVTAYSRSQPVPLVYSAGIELRLERWRLTIRDGEGDQLQLEGVSGQSVLESWLHMCGFQLIQRGSDSNFVLEVIDGSKDPLKGAGATESGAESSPPLTTLPRIEDQSGQPLHAAMRVGCSVAMPHANVRYLSNVLRAYARGTRLNVAPTSQQTGLELEGFGPEVLTLARILRSIEEQAASLEASYRGQGEPSLRKLGPEEVHEESLALTHARAEVVAEQLVGLFGADPGVAPRYPLGSDIRVDVGANAVRIEGAAEWCAEVRQAIHWLDREVEAPR